MIFYAGQESIANTAGIIIVSRTALIAIAAFLTVYETTEFQLPPKTSQLVKFQAMGLAPAPDEVRENEKAEDSIFEVPPEDERQLEMARAMGGMNMDDDGSAKAPKMKLNPDGTMASFRRRLDLTFA